MWITLWIVWISEYGLTGGLFEKECGESMGG